MLTRRGACRPRPMDNVMKNALLAPTIIMLSKMNNDIIAAANNALTGFGRIVPENLAFTTMKGANLIREDGRPFDDETLLAALSFETNRQVNEDIFV